ncbi:MAG: hypothetical protein ACFFBD_25530, partial [Candidatus Hodarchaeota archaeon]
TKFNIDARDRTNEFQRSYDDGNNQSSKFVGLGFPPKLHVGGFSNAKLLTLHNPEPYKSFRLFMPDTIYERYEQFRGDEDERPIIDVRNLRKNVNLWAKAKTANLKELLASPNLDADSLRDFLFITTINRELRGFQIFAERVITQEIIFEYEGTGILYLNVETSSIRQSIRNTQAMEKYKNLSARIYAEKQLLPEDEKKFVQLLETIVSPEAGEIHKHKQTFVIFLP